MKYEIGAWKVNVPDDIEIYSSPGYPHGGTQCELIPHSQYGYRFKQDATDEEKRELVQQAKPGFKLFEQGEAY